jgi:rod shape-determining protein MreD
MTDTSRNFMQMILDGARVLIAHGIVAMLVLVLMANWVLPYFAVLKPQIVLVAVFYWMLYRPTMMPPWLIFCVGVLLDCMNPVMPLGLHGFSYLLIAGLLKPRRRMLMGQPFMMVWVAFIVVMMTDIFIKCLVLWMFSPYDIQAGVVVLNGVVTILLFPVVLMFMVNVHRILPHGRGLISN